MQPLFTPRAVPLFDQETHRSPIPANFRSAVARSGGQEPALGLRLEGRPPGPARCRAPWTAASSAASLSASVLRFNHWRSEQPWTL